MVEVIVAIANAFMNRHSVEQEILAWIVGTKSKCVHLNGFKLEYLHIQYTYGMYEPI